MIATSDPLTQNGRC